MGAEHSRLNINFNSVYSRVFSTRRTSRRRHCSPEALWSILRQGHRSRTV